MIGDASNPPDGLLSLMLGRSVGTEETPHEPYGPIDALEYAVATMGTWVRDGEVYIPWIDEQMMVAVEKFTAVYQSLGYGSEEKKFVGYQVEELSAAEWKEVFLTNGRTADYVRRRLAENLRLNFPMPRGANEFLAELADGLQNPAAPKVKKTLRHRDTLLALVAKRVSDAYRYPLGATKVRLKSGSPPLCGCVVAASALDGHGIFVDFSRADTICRDKSLPVDIAEKNYVFAPRDTKREGHEKNVFREYLPYEFRADARKRYTLQLERAAGRMKLALPEITHKQ